MYEIMLWKSPGGLCKAATEKNREWLRRRGNQIEFIDFRLERRKL